MKTFLTAFLLFFALSARAAEPPNYTLPIPDKSHYASAIVVEQCAEAVAVILVDEKGGLHPMHWKDFGSKQAIFNAIENEVPSHTTLEVTLACPDQESKT